VEKNQAKCFLCEMKKGRGKGNEAPTARGQNETKAGSGGERGEGEGGSLLGDHSIPAWEPSPCHRLSSNNKK